MEKLKKMKKFSIALCNFKKFHMLSNLFYTYNWTYRLLEADFISFLFFLFVLPIKRLVNVEQLHNLSKATKEASGRTNIGSHIFEF